MKNYDKKIIQIGSWYRDTFALYLVDTNKKFKKIMLKGYKMDFYLPNKKLKNNIINNLYCVGNNSNKNEIHTCVDIIKNDSPNCQKFIYWMITNLKNLFGDVEVVEQLDNKEYDNIVKNNIVFLKLFDAWACNTLLECIVRNTPIIINKLDAVVEYLGNDYPLYYENLAEITNLLSDEKILSAHEYLKKMDKNFIEIEYFKNQIIDLIK